jgi:CO/xanthine dehydrogenase Mo-binding subunit
VWTREESMIAHHKRHPISITARWGARNDGTITAVEAEVLADGGAYASTSMEVLKAATLFVSGCYEIENIAVEGYAVYTNNIPSGAFRGFGAPQTQFAGEVMITRLAQALGIDPIDIRRRNIYREGSIEPTHEALPQGVSALEVLESCVEEARVRWGYGVDQGEPLLAGHLRRGIGIACGIKNVGYSYGYPEQATATVEIYGVTEMERAVIRAGVADVGQGTHLILRQIVAETLALPLEKVTIISDDSSETPNTGSVSASRMTYMGGRAVQNAAAAAKEKWGYSDDEHVEATVQFRPTITTPLDLETHSARPNYCYGYAAQAVEVEVNMLTGQVQVLRIISAHDVGKAINIQQVSGQIEGCLAQALGYALMENFQIREGHVLTPRFNTYLLPTILDMPIDVTSVILEFADPGGPYGARGMAEMPLIPFAPAVASAIYAATGVWLKQLPMTPERVLAALSGRTGL